MSKRRKLWKVTQGYSKGRGTRMDPATVERPESLVKVYDIYVRNNVNEARARVAAGRSAYDHTDVWLDERDGRGWQHYERIMHDGSDGHRARAYGIGG